MQYFIFVYAALTAFGLSSTAALPVEHRQVDEKCIEESPQYQQVKRNQSAVFALQFIGSALGDEEVDEVCNTLTSGGYCKWAEQGLVLDDIEKPICDAKATTPNATLTLPRVVSANTNVFSTQLLNAFSPTNKTTFSYLCDNLRYIQLSGFLLNDAAIINATCTASHDLLSPQPFSPIAEINHTAVSAYRRAGSKLYAFQYASAANTSSELDRICAHAPEYRANWHDLQLNASVVEDTLCSFTEPLTVDEAKAATTKWASRQFLAVIENVSNEPGYRRWLCENLDEDAMARVDLDGGFVRGRVCGDAGGETDDDDEV